MCVYSLPRFDYARAGASFVGRPHVACARAILHVGDQTVCIHPNLDPALYHAGISIGLSSTQHATFSPVDEMSASFPKVGRDVGRCQGGMETGLTVNFLDLPLQLAAGAHEQQACLGEAGFGVAFVVVGALDVEARAALLGDPVVAPVAGYHCVGGYDVLCSFAV